MGGLAVTSGSIIEEQEGVQRWGSINVIQLSADIIETWHAVSRSKVSCV